MPVDGMNGNSTVMCAGTPMRAEASKRSRSSPTSASASGTLTISADPVVERVERLAEVRGCDGPLRAASPSQREPPCALWLPKASRSA